MHKFCVAALILSISISGFCFNGDQILQMNERYSAEYFWNEVNPFNGLIRDRTAPDSPCSVAAVGFGLVSNCISAENGWIPKKFVYERILATLKTFKNLENFNGFYYHFIDMWTGKRAMLSEISSIDTALFIAGALFAGQYFKGTEAETLAKELYDRIDWNSMRNGSPFISMGYSPEKGYLPYYWDTYSECMILYILAIGSDTHPIPAEIWNRWYRNKKGKGETEHISSGPESLFTYQYSHGFIDFRYIEDEFTNYFENSKKAILYNIEFSKKESHKTFREGFWGISAGDGPSGYRNHGARLFGTDGTVVPYAIVASTPFLPEISLKGLTKLWTIKDTIWGRYGFRSAFNLELNWYSPEFIGIDKGIEMLMSENYRNEFVWNYFMELSCVKNAIKRIGFKQLQRPEENVKKMNPDTLPDGMYPDALIVENFERGFAKFGAGAWHGGNSTVNDCVVEITDSISTESNEYSLKIFYSVEPDGKFNGAWLKLGDLNAENCEFLTFSVKGDTEEGFTETFKIEIKEPGAVAVYVIEGVTSEWQEVSIPLSEFDNSENMKWKNLSEIAIVFEDWRATDKTGIIYFDNFYFN